MSRPATEPAFEDLTARARIRDAAIRLFAEHGVEGTTIRAIAREARVSGGLVRHHFGSKDDLRASCDAYALSRLLEIKEQAIASPGFITSAQPAALMLVRYFARSMVDGSPAADSMFEEMVAVTESWLAQHHEGQIPDPRAYSAVLVAMELGSLVMREQLSRVLGADVLEPEGNTRLLRARLDFYSLPLLSQEFAQKAQRALDQR